MGTQPSREIPVPNPANPTWSELSEFINTQNEANRAVIDRWFTLAARVLAVLVVAVSIGLGLFGWKTLADAKATAEQAARSEATKVATDEATRIAQDISTQVAEKAANKAATDAATTQVKIIMQDPHIQRLVQSTAEQLYREGAYKEAVKNAVHEQMQAAITEGVEGDYLVTINGVPNQSLGITKRLPKKP